MFIATRVGIQCSKTPLEIALEQPTSDPQMSLNGFIVGIRVRVLVAESA